MHSKTENKPSFSKQQVENINDYLVKQSKQKALINCLCDNLKGNIDAEEITIASRDLFALLGELANTFIDLHSKKAGYALALENEMAEYFDNELMDAESKLPHGYQNPFVQEAKAISYEELQGKSFELLEKMKVISQHVGTPLCKDDWQERLEEYNHMFEFLIILLFQRNRMRENNRLPY